MNLFKFQLKLPNTNTESLYNIFRKIWLLRTKLKNYKKRIINTE